MGIGVLVGGWSTDGCVLCIVLVTRLVRGDSGGDPGLVLLYVCEGGVEGGGLKLEMLGCLVIEHYFVTYIGHTFGAELGARASLCSFFKCSAYL